MVWTTSYFNRAYRGNFRETTKVPSRVETTTNPTAHLQPTSHGPASLNLLVKLMQECHSLQINEKTCCGKTRWPTYFWAAQQIVHQQQTNPTPTALLISE